MCTALGAATNLTALEFNGSEYPLLVGPHACRHFTGARGPAHHESVHVRAAPHCYSALFQGEPLWKLVRLVGRQCTNDTITMVATDANMGTMDAPDLQVTVYG